MRAPPVVSTSGGLAPELDETQPCRRFSSNAAVISLAAIPYTSEPKPNSVYQDDFSYFIVQEHRRPSRGKSVMIAAMDAVAVFIALAREVTHKTSGTAPPVGPPALAHWIRDPRACHWHRREYGSFQRRQCAASAITALSESRNGFRQRCGNPGGSRIAAPRNSARLA